MTFSKEEREILVANKIIPPSANDAQVAYFFEVCKRKKLDPFLKQVHMVERKERDGDGWKTSYTIQASLDGMRAIAQRQCKITAYKRWTKKIGEEFYGVCEIATEDRGTYYDEVPFSEYCQKKSDGTVTKFWKQFPQTMIKKVAEESVLRMLAPEDLTGVYGDDEMQQADHLIETSKPVALIPESNAVKLDDSFPEPERVEPIKDVQFSRFDPTKEPISFGKYSGCMWSEVPADYLTWITGQKGKQENKQKAEATLKYLESMRQQQPDDFDGVFGKKEKPQVPLFDIIESQLTEIVRDGDLEKLEQWAKENKEKISTLTDEEKKILRKSYQTSKKQLEGQIQ
jgi:phage recombination protein Bet